ncbi:RGAG4: Retrotransposon gag domain-containing protein 4 [Crotalus adamanteus]|uniref:RGAG4: Retrotransposon gag domain-containing protein 4 n=1 Tax=Crotalus adamanteus TaxID=8729 RepID=A0AAW1B3X2_CROAD
MTPGYVLVREDPLLPSFKVTFDGQPENLAYFLTQVWNYVERYGDRYPDDGSQVNVISVNLEGEVAEWLVSLYDEAAPELHDVDAFMQELWNRFEDPTKARKSHERA